MIQAPCKINLHLSIGGRRPDGFHSLESIFVPLGLSDTLRLERRGGGGEALSLCNESGGPDIPPEENLVLKALSLFREETGFDGGLCLHLQKRIPAGAGLGGGSSDAAAALTGLNLLAGRPLSPPRLAALAARLGSDVPFFLSGGAAFVAGRGEVVEPAACPQGLPVLLVKPPFHSCTAAAYRLLDRFRDAALVKAGESPPKETLLRALASGAEKWPFFNDFLPAFLAEGGETAAAYRSVLGALKEAGALFSGLSGSGSCCFGIFPPGEIVERVEKALSDGKKYVKSTFFLAQKANAVLEY